MAKNGSFVDQLVADPDNIPDMILLNGFGGRSSLEGHTRLYLNAVLSEYYEIPTDAILYTQEAPSPTGSPLTTHFVWVKSDAELIRKGKNAPDRKVQFLTGDIQRTQAAQVPQAAAQAGPTGVMNCTQSPPVCGNTAWQGCPDKK